MNKHPVIFCDTVQAVSVHNGVARIQFIRLEGEKGSSPALELLLPVAEARSLMKALQSFAKDSQSASEEIPMTNKVEGFAPAAPRRPGP